MQNVDIDVALDFAREMVPASAAFGVGEKPTLTKCDLAGAVATFLEALKPKAGFFGGIGIGIVLGQLGKWKKANGC